MINLRKTRVTLAAISIVATTALFLDFTGTIHHSLAFMAKIQFIPAILALNLAVVISIILITLLFGRIYCSVICPLGIFQDLATKANRNKNKQNYSPAKTWLRYTFLTLFIVALFTGLASIIALIEPYSTYGRMVSNLISPIYQWGNNLLAYIAERSDSYVFYKTDVWIKSASTFTVALITLVVIMILSWRSGRTYCNTICPVGTILGVLSKLSLYNHHINKDKCNNCGLCAKNCKASCINSKTYTIDNSRCVACFNCIDKCSRGAINYSIKNNGTQNKNTSRRNFLTLIGFLVTSTVVKAQEKKVDGGLAFIEDKKIPERQTPITPAGSKSIRNFTTKCTACQLCVSVCPNQVLRPSTTLATFMQPEMSFDRGYCRPECTKCSEVCPSGAINMITAAIKSATQIGHAVWIEKNCVVLTDNIACDNCAHHCPTGAITMIEKADKELNPQKIPAINIERCIGCGACENLCAARPLSAIYVEGHTMHKTV